MCVKHLTVEVVRDVGERIEDTCFVGDGSGLDVYVVEVLLLLGEDGR